jgi:hypothetical protein
LYRSVPLIKVLLERLRRAKRALRVLRSTLTMLTSQEKRGFLRIHEAESLSLWLDNAVAEEADDHNRNPQSAAARTWPPNPAAPPRTLSFLRYSAKTFVFCWFWLSGGVQ